MLKTIKYSLMLGAMILIYASAGFAGINPLTVRFDSGTTTFTTGSTGSANYIVSIGSLVPGTLSLNVHTDAAWASQIQNGGTSLCSGGQSICSQDTFSLQGGQSCCLMLTLNGASLTAGSYALSPSVTTHPAAYTGQAASTSIAVASAPQEATLAASVSTLALAVNCQPSSSCTTTQNAALTGHARQITITNTSSATTAFNVEYNISPSLPTGTSVSPASCGDIAPNGTCVLTIQPGHNASSNCNTGTAPAASMIQVSGNNTNTISTSVYVLTYGCIYQDGYLFSVDDTYADYPESVSIGGVVMQTADNVGAPDGIAWDSSSGCTTSPFLDCYTTNADSGINGTNTSEGNTGLIYSVLTTTHGELATAYAAGLCTETIGMYNDWYLPAICMMGYGLNADGINCGTSSSPAIQNIQSNLIDGPGVDIAGLTTNIFYWPSTEYPVAPEGFAFLQEFQTGGASQQTANYKMEQFWVRCVRNMTP
jgi:hypothetical protein